MFSFPDVSMICDSETTGASRSHCCGSRRLRSSILPRSLRCRRIAPVVAEHFCAAGDQRKPRAPAVAHCANSAGFQFLNRRHFRQPQTESGSFQNENRRQIDFQWRHLMVRQTHQKRRCSFRRLQATDAEPVAAAAACGSVPDHLARTVCGPDRRHASGCTRR